MKDLSFLIFLLYIIQITSSQNNDVSIRREDFQNGTTVIECRVYIIQSKSVYLSCPISGRSDKTCFYNCADICKRGRNCSEAIRCYKIENKETDFIKLRYLVDPTKLSASGNWFCQYKNLETKKFKINKVKQLPKKTSTKPTTTTSKKLITSTTPKKKDPIVDKDRDIDVVSTVPPTNTQVSNRYPSNKDRLPYSIWNYLTRPEIILILIIALGISLLLNLCFLIRCVLLKSVIDNHYRGVPTNRCVLSCLCLDDRRWWSLSHLGHGPGANASSSQAALALLAAHGGSTNPGSICDHHTTTTLLGANTPSARIYYDKRLSHSLTPLLLNKTGNIPNDNNNTTSLPHFYRCQGNGTSAGTIGGIANGNGGHQIPSGVGGDSLQQIYDDLSNGSAVIHPPLQNSMQAGYYHPKYSLQQTINSNPQPSSDIMLLDNSSTITTNQNSIGNNNDANNNNQTSNNGAEVMTVGNQTPQGIPNGSLSRQQSLSNHSNMSNIALPSNHQSQQPSYYHPSLGNYVIVSGPVVANNDNQYTIATNNTHGNYIQHGYPNYQYHQYNYGPNQIPPSHISGVSPIPSAPGSLIGGSGVTNNSGATNSITSNSNPNINPSASSPQILSRNIQSHHVNPVAVINSVSGDNSANAGGIETIPNPVPNTSSNLSNIINHPISNNIKNTDTDKLMDDVNKINHSSVTEENMNLLSNEDRSALSRHPHQTLPATPDVNNIPQYASITPLTRIQIDTNNNNNNKNDNLNIGQEVQSQLQKSQNEDPTLPPPPPSIVSN